MSNLWIRVAYSALLAVVVALTVGFGIAMISAGPQQPDTPALTFAQLQNSDSNPQATDQVVQTVDRFYQDSYDYRRAYPDYQRNVFLAFAAFAILVGAIGVALPSVVNALRLGLLLAALLLFVYGTRTALTATPNPAPAGSSISALLGAGSPPGLDFAGRFLRFAISLIGLLVLLFVGLWRLTEWTFMLPSALSDQR